VGTRIPHQALVEPPYDLDMFAYGAMLDSSNEVGVGFFDQKDMRFIFVLGSDEHINIQMKQVLTVAVPNSCLTFTTSSSKLILSTVPHLSSIGPDLIRTMSPMHKQSRTRKSVQ
jgi:hypothetical protein